MSSIYNHLKGPALMLYFCMALPIADTLIRLLTEDGFNAAQLLFMVYGMVSLFLFTVLPKGTLASVVKSPLKYWHLIRVLSFFFAALAWVTALEYVPFVQLYALSFLAPIIASVLAVYLLNEQLTTLKVWGLGIGFAGVLVIIRPGVSDVSPYLLLGLLTPLFWALVTSSTKRLSASFSQLTLLFLLACSTSILASPFAIASWQPLSVNQFCFVLFAALIGCSAHYSLISAYTYSSLTQLAPIEFSMLISASLCSILVFNEPLDLFTIIGAVMIIASNIMLILFSNRHL